MTGHAMDVIGTGIVCAALGFLAGVIYVAILNTKARADR